MMSPPRTWSVQGGAPKQTTLLWPFVFQLLSTSKRIHNTSASFKIPPSSLVAVRRKDLALYLEALWPDAYQGIGRQNDKKLDAPRAGFGPASTGYFIKSGLGAQLDRLLFTKSTQYESNSPRLGYRVRSEDRIQESIGQRLLQGIEYSKSQQERLSHIFGTFFYELLDNSLRWGPYDVKPVFSEVNSITCKPDPFIATCHFAIHRRIMAIDYIGLSPHLHDYLSQFEDAKLGQGAAYLQLTFIDNGVGLPARHLGRRATQITNSDSHEAISSCLNLSRQAGRMYSRSKGYARVISLLRDLNGCLIVSSGKSIAFMGSGKEESNEGSVQDLFEGDVRMEYYLSGCVASVIIPLRSLDGVV